MPLHATDLIELAEAGQSAIALARTQAEGALALAPKRGPAGWGLTPCSMDWMSYFSATKSSLGR